MFRGLFNGSLMVKSEFYKHRKVTENMIVDCI